MGQPNIQCRPTYLKHAAQHAGDCLRLDGNGHWTSIPGRVNRPALFHLLWTGVLVCDLAGSPLGSAAMVNAAEPLG